MRLLLLVERLGPEGGMERYIEVALGALRAAGDDVRVLARTLEAADPDAREIRWADEHDPGSVEAGAAVRAEIAARPYDAVIAHNVLDDEVLAAARSAVRFVYHLHDHRPFCPNGDRVYPRGGQRCGSVMGNACLVHSLVDGCMYGPRPRSAALVRRRAVVRDLIAAADAVVANSPFIALRAAQNGVAGALPIAPPLPDDAFTMPARPATADVLFVGRVQPSKGLPALVRAVAQIPEHARPRIRVAGTGPDLDEAVRTAQHEHVVLDLLGRQSPAGVRAAIDASSMIALPALWDEPFGMTGIEAFARGRPVVAFDVGGISSWLRDGVNGLLVEPGNIHAFADAIQRAGDPVRQALMGTAARVEAERYRSAPIVARLRTIYGGRG